MKFVYQCRYEVEVNVKSVITGEDKTKEFLVAIENDMWDLEDIYFKKGYINTAHCYKETVDSLRKIKHYVKGDESEQTDCEPEQTDCEPEMDIVVIDEHGNRYAIPVSVLEKYRI